MTDSPDPQTRGLYRPNDPPFVSMFRSYAEENRQRAESLFAPTLRLVEALLDTHYALAAQHWWTHHVTYDRGVLGQLVFATLHKSQIALFAALEQIRGGFYGPARPLFRYVFEAQVAAKFASVADNSGLAEKWSRGETIYFANGVLKRIDEPNRLPLSQLWTVLNQFTHATKYAQQVSPFIDEQEDELVTCSPEVEPAKLTVLDRRTDEAGPIQRDADHRRLAGE